MKASFEVISRHRTSLQVGSYLDQVKLRYDTVLAVVGLAFTSIVGDDMSLWRTEAQHG